uniref:Uncharacterized protein n=1 Tax=Romanomermis culicivorax TaxID=13658 RepID=A0A915ILT0_ROMCU
MSSSMSLRKSLIDAEETIRSAPAGGSVGVEVVTIISNFVMLRFKISFEQLIIGQFRGRWQHQVVQQFFSAQHMCPGHSRQQVCIDGGQEGKPILKIDIADQAGIEVEPAVRGGQQLGKEENY